MSQQLPIDPESKQASNAANAFNEVFAAELVEIGIRQSNAGSSAKESLGEDAPSHTGASADPKELAGIALSGGGIRAATSGLGVLQALRKMGILPVFDYLSTVSGGGFAGSWWSAWTSREFDSAATQEDKFFPPPERTQPERDERGKNAAQKAQDESADILIPPSPEVLQERRQDSDPAHHLRLFSNYLTPQKGLMSGDTWRAITVISRDLGLTWLVSIPILFAIVLVAQSYFTLQKDSETEFLYPYSHFQEDKALNAKLNREMTAAVALDRIVHKSDTGSSKTLSLERLKSRPRFAKLDETVAIDRATDSLVKDEAEDSLASNDIGEKKDFGILKSDIDSIDIFAQRLHVLDSLHKADPSQAIAIDATRKTLDRALDNDVDTVRSKLAGLHTALVRHRWQVRDGWLFNDTHLKFLTSRLLTASYLPIALLAWVIMFISLWMANVSNAPLGGNIIQGSFAYLTGLVSFWAILWGFPQLLGRELDLSWDTLGVMSVVWAAVALVLLNRVIWDEAHRYWKAHKASILSDDLDSTRIKQELSRLLDMRRARIVLSHERLLLVTFLVSVWLLFGGFGHEVINYIFYYHPDRNSETGDFWQWAVRLSSVAAIISAITGSAYAAKSATSSASSNLSGSDRREAPKPSKIKGMLMSVAPPLILLILVCGVSWAGHWVLQDVVFRAEDHANRNLITIVVITWLFAAVAMYYVIEELRFKKRSHSIRRTLFGMQLGVGVLSLAFLHNFVFLSSLRWVAIGICLLSWVTIVILGRREKVSASGESGNRSSDSSMKGSAKKSAPQLSPARSKPFGAMAGTTLAILIFSQAVLVTGLIVLSDAHMPFHWPYLTGIAVCFGVLLCELLWGSEGNHEARLLLGGITVMCTIFLFIPPISEDPHWGVTHVLATLVSIALGLVIYIGWRLDPNALSVHAFYRSRIVRAYLGASNWLRGRASVSEVHPNDDVSLSALNNAANGAPYHLVNTTLNLLGTKSLEAAQRHASNFIMTKKYCGSVTTGYRPTEDYMSGEMTLGTAVAISGAAASPVMGSASKSGAITMLMSLLNIRLGYWAPNPTGSRWRDAQPRFWPYYLIKESLAQTTGIGAFCYLTDGGHFDNTGLYPLIERACRYIVVCDNGADPMTHFNDVGNAFRRCRIDFGAEFALEGLREMTGFAAPVGSTRQHWLRGTVTYSHEHLRTLWGDNWDAGMSDNERQMYRTGTILILKPVILGDEPADVLQYGLEFADFPQQSTANQWFTENQFESYRRLGYWSAQTAFGQESFDGKTREEKLEAIRETPVKPEDRPLTSTPIPSLSYGTERVPAL